MEKMACPGLRLALVTGVSEYDNSGTLPGVLKGALLAKQALKPWRFYTRCVASNVRRQTFTDSIADWLLQVERDAKNHPDPLLAFVYIGHSITSEGGELLDVLSFR